MYKTYSKWEKVLIISSPFIVIGLIFLFFHSIDKAIDNRRSKVIQNQVTITYAQDLKNQAYQDKQQKKNQTPQQIAEGVLLNSVGLGKTKSGYDKMGIDNSDGLFVKQAIINGNAVPYSSNYKSDSNDQSLTDFDESDEEYWSNVKKNDYQKMKDNAQQQVDEFRNNNKKYQEQEIENDVRKAQYDAKQKGQMKDDKKQSSSTN